MKLIKKLMMTIIEPFTGIVSRRGGLSRTLAPKRDTLLLVGLADAVVTVAVHVLTGVAVMQVDIGGAVRAGAGAELRQVARVTGVTAWSARRLQLHSHFDSKQQS